MGFRSNTWYCSFVHFVQLYPLRTWHQIVFRAKYHTSHMTVNCGLLCRDHLISLSRLILGRPLDCKLMGIGFEPIRLSCDSLRPNSATSPSCDSPTSPHPSYNKNYLLSGAELAETDSILPRATSIAAI